MTTTTEIAAEKTWLTDRIAKLDIERDRVLAQLSDIEAAERVMAKFTTDGSAPQKNRGRPRKVTPGASTSAQTKKASLKPPTARSLTKAPGAISMSDAALEAVGSFPGAQASDILTYMKEKHGMIVRPNHLGISLQRHLRAGRLQERAGAWYTPEGMAKAA